MGNKKIMTGAVISMLTTLWVVSVFADDFADKALRPARESIDIRQDTQKSEDRWANEKAELTAKYESLEKRKDLLARANKEASEALAKKTDTVLSLKQQLSDISKTSEEIEPYLYQLYERLRRSIDESPPFLAGERKKRVDKLEGIITDPSIKISEKFRRLTEALMIEAEYGGTIEVYPERISIQGKDVQMRIFRLGRLSLFCQSLDRKISGFWDAAREEWTVLPGKYNRDIDAAMEIGAKRRPAVLVNLPLGRMAVR